MPEFKINPQGFVTSFLISGPEIRVPVTEIRDKNQLVFERKLRAEIAPEDDFTPPSSSALGKAGIKDNKWEWGALGNNIFADRSAFYHLLRAAEMWVSVYLISDEDREVSANVWTYAAADLYVNGQRALKNTPPVYKPIKKQSCVLKLNRGENFVFARLRTLGARDTRTLFGLQLLSARGVKAYLPDEDGKLTALVNAENLLQGIKREGSLLVSACPVTEEITVTCPEKRVWKEGLSFEIPRDCAYAELSTEGGIKRRMQFQRAMKPVRVSPETDDRERRSRICGEICGNDYAWQTIMRFRAGINDESDIEALKRFIAEIASHADCSDFILNAFFRLIKNYSLPEDILASFRETALAYRYWMDEDGADAMCFWSENHSILFFSNQLIAGLFYPEDTFRLSGLTGRQASALGEEKCRQWLDSVIKYGFEEFMSSSYSAVTACALLSIIDFGPSYLAEKAKKVLDGQLRQICLHTFRGSVFSPEGRVYRDVIYPWASGTQAIANYLLPGMNDAKSMWLGAFAECAYEPPRDLADIASKPRELAYSCGNAQINLTKTDSYLLTSVESPKKFPGRWDSGAYSTYNPEHFEGFKFAFTKALNERFHGTTCFEPGTYGYQQHMVYAALAGDCCSFINHPGETADLRSMRPGYWNGNGIMPAITQRGNKIALIYALGDRHPVCFTHVFWPESKFDESRTEQNLLFGRRDGGYLALYSYEALTPFTDVLDGSEYRVYAPLNAYLYTAAGKDEYESFEAFIAAVKAETPVFDTETLTLTGRDISLTYKEGSDDTQYLG